MEHGDRPAGVSQPVDTPPGGRPDALTQRAGDRDGEEHVECHSAEPDPDRAVGGSKRENSVNQPYRDIAVTHRGDHVHPDEGDAEERQVPMERLGKEARPALSGPSHRRDVPEHYGGRKQNERHEPGRSREIPQCGGAMADRGQHARRHRAVNSRPARPASGMGQSPV